MNPLSVASSARTPFARQPNGAAKLADTAPGTLAIGERLNYPLDVAKGVRVALEVSGEAQKLAEQMLCDAHGLIESGWCQGAGAVDEMGRPIEPSSAFARRWSAAGALERVWRRSDEDQDEALEAFERANLALAAAVRDVPQRWNDDAARTQDEVLDSLTRAQRFLGSHGHAPLELVDNPLGALDRYEAIPGFLFERPA